MAVVVRRADTQKNHEFDASDMPSLLRSVEDSRHFGRGSLETPSGLVMTTTSAFILTRPRPSGTDYDFTWYPAPGAGDASGSGQAVAVEGAATEQLQQEVQALRQKVDLLADIVSPIFDTAVLWRDSSVSTSHPSSIVDGFKRNLRQVYDNKCAVLGTQCLAVSAHIFRKSMKPVAEKLGIDVWSLRNGMALCKPLERAFDNSEICFFEDNTGNLVLHILEPKLRDLKLGDSKYLNTQDKATWAAADSDIAELTFADVEGRHLQMPAFEADRPYKRALSLHARQARKFAIKAGWQTASEWNFTDYGSHGSVTSTVIEWLNASQLALAEAE